MEQPSSDLDRLSGYFFTAGFLISRLKVTSFAFLNAFLNTASLLAYLVGYSAWFAAALFYPHHPRADAWYGFAEFKHQYQIASVLGMAATIICLTYPLLLLPTLWIYAASNSIWAIAEYHKMQNPLSWDEDFSSSRQEVYLTYTYLTTSISILTAAASTLAFLYPPLAAMTLLTSTIIGTSLSIVSLYYWQKSAYDIYEPDEVIQSYQTMSNTLGISSEQKFHPENNLTLEEKEKAFSSHSSIQLWKTLSSTIPQSSPFEKTNTDQSCLENILSV